MFMYLHVCTLTRVYLLGAQQHYTIIYVNLAPQGKPVHMFKIHPENLSSNTWSKIFQLVNRIDTLKAAVAGALFCFFTVALSCLVA